MTRSATALVACTLLFAACTVGSPDDGSVEVTEVYATAGTTNSLTTAQQKLVLTMIDDACSDAWCETDFEWSFKKMVCHFDLGTCTLTATLSTGGTTYWRSCKMHSLTSFKSMVHTYSNGFKALTDSMWTKTDACATKMMDSIPTS